MAKDLSSYSLFQKLGFSSLYDQMSRPLIVADNLRTPENMGSVLRLAGNIGAGQVLFVMKEGDSRVRSWKIKKTASGADEKVDWAFCELEELWRKIPDDYKVVAVETCESAENIYGTSLPEKAVFVIGNEIYGIRDELLEKADQVVYIPIPGMISSLNVTHSLAIALFEWLRQTAFKEKSNK
jgi:tRNA G18 (ribose-2'-O)-methylase SpoU